MNVELWYVFTCMIHIWCWFRTDHRTWSSPLPPPCSPGRGSACVVWGSSSAGTAWRRCHKWKPCHPPRAWTGGSSAGTSRGKSPRKCCKFITENQHKISIDFGGLRDGTFLLVLTCRNTFWCAWFSCGSLWRSPRRGVLRIQESHTSDPFPRGTQPNAERNIYFGSLIPLLIQYFSYFFSKNNWIVFKAGFKKQQERISSNLSLPGGLLGAWQQPCHRKSCKPSHPVRTAERYPGP